MLSSIAWTIACIPVAPLCFSDYGSIEPTTSAESRFETFEQINSLLGFHMKPSKRQPPDSPHRIQGHFPHPKKGHKELPYERLQNITKKRTWNSCATQVGTLRSRGGISFRKDLSTLGWFRWGFRSDVEFTTWPLTLIPSPWGNCHRIKKITIGRSHFFFVSILLVVRTQPWWPIFFGVKASEEMIKRRKRWSLRWSFQFCIFTERFETSPTWKVQLCIDKFRRSGRSTTENLSCEGAPKALRHQCSPSRVN